MTTSKSILHQATPKPLAFEAEALQVLSARLLRSHWENNYCGAVKRLNAIREQLSQMSFSQTPGYQLNGVKREELIAANSMRLHELYFNSLASETESMAPPLELALCASFGSVARWAEEFAAMGKALSGGSGWALLCFQPEEGLLVNQWAADHTHMAVGGVPILALDMYEHAYHMDFGAQAGAYVDAFMSRIAWDKVYARYQDAVHRASDGLGVDPDEIGDAMLLDVRRAGAYAQSNALIAGASWRDPADVAQWGNDLRGAGKVVVYCVYGHEVGRATALRLRAQGVDASFLVGGIEGWAGAQRPLQDKGATP